MQAKHLKTGVVYAYVTSKYSNPRPVVILDTTETYAAPRYMPTPSAIESERKRGSEHYENYLKILDSPYWRKGRRDNKGRVFVNFPGGRTYGYSETSQGYLVATIKDIPNHLRGSEQPESPSQGIRRLLGVSLADALAVTPNINRGGNLEDVVLTVVAPRNIVGEWEEISEKRAAEDELNQNLVDQAVAESEARIAQAVQRVSALRSLNLPGQITEPKETRSAWGKTVPVFSRELTTGVTLTMAQVDALLSLIPDGAIYLPPSDTEDDGWTFSKPAHSKEA